MYDSGQLLPIFTSILGQAKQYSRNEYYFACPFCHKRKMALNLSNGKYHCWVCNSAGRTLLSLAYKLNVDQSQIRKLREILTEEVKYVKEDIAETKLILPQEFQPLWKPTKQIEYKHAIAYLSRRGITACDILRYNMGFCINGEFANRIIVPSYDAIGELNYFVGRDFFETSSMKYKNPTVSKNVVGLDYHVNYKHDIFLCEGIFDAIAIKLNAIPLFGKTVQSKLKQKIIEKEVKNVYLVLDNDALKQTIDIAEKFMKDGIHVFVVQLPKKDPSEIGPEKIQDIIKETRELKFQDLISLKLSLTGHL